MLIFITFLSFAQDAEKSLESRTLRELSEDTSYPIKKLGSKLGLKIDDSQYDTPLSRFGITVERVNQAMEKYEEEKTQFIWNIVATGMIIVFVALIATGAVVGLLEYFHRLSNRKGRRKSQPELKAEPETAPVPERRRRRYAAPVRRSGEDEQPDWHTIVAIATAIRLHESSIEEANRILATWTKASVSAWKTSRTMPNRRFLNSRWGK